MGQKQKTEKKEKESKAKDEERERKKERKKEERLNNGNNNGQLRIEHGTSGGARKAAWAKNYKIYVYTIFQISTFCNNSNWINIYALCGYISLTLDFTHKNILD